MCTPDLCYQSTIVNKIHFTTKLGDTEEFHRAGEFKTAVKIRHVR